MSSKNTEKNLIGQPIFKQLVGLIPKNKFESLVLKHKSNRYYNQFSSVQFLGSIINYVVWSV